MDILAGIDPARLADRIVRAIIAELAASGVDREELVNKIAEWVADEVEASLAKRRRLDIARIARKRVSEIAKTTVADILDGALPCNTSGRF